MSSFGPETITITQLIDGTYRYSVHNYSNRNEPSSTGLANSQARVTVFSSNGTQSFFVPTTAGTLWTVFEIVNGDIVPINAMSSVSDPGVINRATKENDHYIILESSIDKEKQQ